MAETQGIAFRPTKGLVWVRDDKLIRKPGFRNPFLKTAVRGREICI